MKFIILFCVVALAYTAYEIKNAMPYNPEWDKPLYDDRDKPDD